MREQKAAIPNTGTWQAGAGRNPARAAPGVEARTAAAEETKSEQGLLMERVVGRSNMQRALKRVVQNRGSAGVDGLTVAELNGWLKAHWLRVKEALLAGEYMPQPVRRVDIPKPQDGVRTLGVPTVSVNCTVAQRAFGLGRDSTSVPSVSRAALCGAEGAVRRRRRHADSSRRRARQLRRRSGMDGPRNAERRRASRRFDGAA